jgi:hypothetical protein
MGKQSDYDTACFAIPTTNTIPSIALRIIITIVSYIMRRDALGMDLVIHIEIDIW